jgi:hypothetical protein
MDTPAPVGALWTVGHAAAYLNAGPVDFQLSPKRVRLMAQDPSCQIRPVIGGTAVGGRRRWYRLLASTVRAERARLLAESGYEDPDWPVEGVPG